MNFKFNSIVLALALAFASSSLLDGVTAANQQQLRGSADLSVNNNNIVANGNECGELDTLCSGEYTAPDAPSVCKDDVKPTDSCKVACAIDGINYVCNDGVFEEGTVGTAFNDPPTATPKPPCDTPEGCVISKPLCGPGIYCEDLPNNDSGIDVDVNSGADLPSYEETCVKHESNDGSFVCTFIARIDPLGMDSITGKNKECIFSQAMESEYCFTTKVVMDMNGDGEVTVEDLTMPDDGDGDGDGIDFNGNAATINDGSSNTKPNDTVDNDNNTGDTTHDHTAVEWAGSGSGVCPETIPTDGDECDKYVGPNSSQISCTYNNFQCRCALQNNINDLIGWACRDNTEYYQASGP